jgi:hypothetical protein
MKIWEFLGNNHREVYEEYCDLLMGEYITGSNNIIQMISYDNKEFYKKWNNKLPITFALGDALAVAYSIERQRI